MSELDLRLANLKIQLDRIEGKLDALLEIEQPPMLNRPQEQIQNDQLSAIRAASNVIQEE